jgi:MFS family permease
VTRADRFEQHPVLPAPAGFWTIGTVVQAALAYALLNDKGWRILVLVSTTPYVLLLVLLPFVPESPRYLLVKGRVDAAQQVLGKVLRVCGRQMPEGTLQPLLSEEDTADLDTALPAEKGEFNESRIRTAVLVLL